MVAADNASRLSHCNIRPESFTSDKPLALKFRALLTEGGAEHLELIRA